MPVYDFRNYLIVEAPRIDWSMDQPKQELFTISLLWKADHNNYNSQQLAQPFVPAFAANVYQLQLFTFRILLGLQRANTHEKKG